MVLIRHCSYARPLVAIRMRIALIILILILTTELFAQNSEDSILNSLKQQFELTEYDKASERIVFNKDTVLIAGNLGNPSNPSRKNVIYKTTDGGEKWRVIEFNGNAWIYDTYHKKDGKIWMGGSDNVIHYSDDFGETWKNKIKPFDPVNRVLSIFMVDSLYGIAGGLSNGLAITNDNWDTSVQIESPIDQKKFQILKQSARDRIDQIAIVDSLIIINQNDYIFYSKVKDIDWVKFSVPVSDFQLNEGKKQIDLSSRNGKHFVVDSELNLIKSYQVDDTFWKSIKDDTTQIDISNFLKYPILSMKVVSTKYEFDKQVHMIAIYNEVIQKANISLKGTKYEFKAKGFKKRTLEIKEKDLHQLLSQNLQIQLSQLSNYLRFSESDYQDYRLVLEKEHQEREDREKWGGNFTSQISLNHPYFTNLKTVTTNFNQNYLEAVFKGNYFPYAFNDQKNSVKVVLENTKGTELIISNANSIFYSLPWTMTYKRETITTYNQGITDLLKSILPNDFNNYEMLLGGQLIYELIEEKIIDDLKYKNGY